MIHRIIDGKLFIHEDGNVYSAEKTATKIKKHTIAIVIDTAMTIPPKTGVTYRLYHLSKTLTKRGHKIIWILCNRNVNTKESLSELCDDVGVKIHILPLALFSDAMYVSSLLKEDEVDVVQYEITQTFVELGIKIRALTKLPVLLEFHDVEATLRDTLGRGEESSLMKFLQYIAGEYSDSIISMTPLDYITLIEKIGIQKEKLFLVPNGVNIEDQIVSTNKSNDTLLFLGNLFYPPNQDAFIYIADELLPELRKETKVVLKSIGMIPPELKGKYSQRDDILILGDVNDKEIFAKEVSSSTIGLCTVFSGSGMKVKILDYCLAGLPVVSTTIGASGYENIKSIVIANEKEVMIRVIAELLGDKEKRQGIGAKNRKRVVELYDWETIADKFEQALSLAQSFNLSRFKKESLDAFWLEEKRYKTEVLSEHFVIDNQKIKMYGE